MLKRATISVVVALSAMAQLPSGAVVGGTQADPGEYPWMAALYRVDPGSYIPFTGQFCGGSLIAPDAVLTAKHCVAGLLQRADSAMGNIPGDALPLGLAVYIGDIALHGSEGERIRVRSIRTISSSQSDVAVLLLQRPSSIAPVAFARPGDEPLYKGGTVSTVLGWGATSEGGSGSDLLLEAEVPVVSDASCAGSYPGAIVPASMVCAGYPQGGVDTCQGDSGGPIFVPKNGEWLVIGTTWFGDGCARPNKPGVYSEVAFAAEFIDNSLNAS